MSRPLVLATNDDGIESYFFQVLVKALAERFDVRVVAPLKEQSWTGRSFTRRGPVAVQRYEGLGVPAWTADGTPSDCANIGLGDRFDRRPDAVVSGINLGFNITLPLVLSSGTVAAATEGALAGLPALAFSQAIPHQRFEAVRARGGRGDPEIEATIATSAARAVEMAASIIAAGPPTGPIVHNINFPRAVKADTPVERTRLAPARLGSCFVPEGDGPIHRFRFPMGVERMPVPDDSDRACIARGHISHCVLDYGAWGQLS